MASIKKSKSRSETEDDEETPSKETLARRRDRKLRDDITNLMVSIGLWSAFLFVCAENIQHTIPFVAGCRYIH